MHLLFKAKLDAFRDNDLWAALERVGKFDDVLDKEFKNIKSIHVEFGKRGQYQVRVFFVLQYFHITSEWGIAYNS